MFVAGFLDTMAFDLSGQVADPATGNANLSPHGPAGTLPGPLCHLPVERGSFPVGGLFICAPVRNRVTGGAHQFLPPAIGGITAIAGVPFCQTFTGIIRGAQARHVRRGVVMAAVMQVTARRHDITLA